MKDNFDGLVQYFINSGISLGEATGLIEKSMIESALARNRGNQCAASKLLGIHRNTLQRKLTEYEIGNGRPHSRRKPATRAVKTKARKATAA